MHDDEWAVRNKWVYVILGLIFFVVIVGFAYVSYIAITGV